MTRPWLLCALLIVVSCTVVRWIGSRIYQEAQPIAVPGLTTNGTIVMADGVIKAESSQRTR